MDNILKHGRRNDNASAQAAWLAGHERAGGVVRGWWRALPIRFEEFV